MSDINKPVLKQDFKDALMTPKGVWIYPKFFEKDRVRKKYTGILACDPNDPDYKAFADAVKAFRDQAYGNDLPKGLTLCVRDGKKWNQAKNTPVKGKVAEIVENSKLIIMHSDNMPGVGVPQDGQIIEADPENAKHRSLIYTGCVGAAKGILVAFRGQYPAVSLWFSEASRLAPGEKLGGRDVSRTFGSMYNPDDDNVGAELDAPMDEDSDDSSGQLDDDEDI